MQRPELDACDCGDLPWSIEVRGVYDGGLIFQCPQCRTMWPRFPEGRLHDKAKELILKWMDL